MAGLNLLEDNKMRLINTSCTVVILFLITSGGIVLGEDKTSEEKKTASTSKNLCINGNFEKSKKSQVKDEVVPVGWRQKARFGWQQLDGLTAFYTEVKRNGKKAKVLKIDTDVLETEFHARTKKLQAGTKEAAPLKTPVPQNKQYSTIGATYGISVWTDKPIKVKKDNWYFFSAEFLGRSSGMFFPKIFIKGYGKGEYKKLDNNLKWVKAENMAGEKAVLYHTYLAMRNDENSGKWKKFSMVINPTMRNKAVEDIGIQIYTYWPRGTFYYDNIVFREATDKEVADYQAEQKRIKAELKKRKEADRKKEGNATRKEKNQQQLEEIEEDF